MTPGAGKQTKSIAFYLSACLVVTMAFFSVVTIGAALWFLKQLDARQFETKVLEYATYLENSLLMPLWNYDIDSIRIIGETFAQNEIMAKIVITSESGDVLYHWMRPMKADFLEQNRTITFDGRVIGHLRLGFNPAFKGMYRRELMFSLFIMPVNLLLLAAITVYFLRRVLKRPLDALMNDMDQIARGTYAFSGKLYGYREFSNIIDRFRQMAKNIRARENELAKVNQVLTDSEARFRAMAESVPCAIFRCAFDPDWTMQFIGPPIENICGFPPTDFIENAIRNYASVIHPDDRNTVEKDVHQAIDEGRKWTLDYRIIHADGKIRWVYEEGVGVLNERGEIICLDGFIVDQTEQRRIAQQLQQSEAYLRTLVETIPDLVWLKDPDGVYLACNPKFERFFGAKESDIVGKTDYDFIARELADFFRENDNAAVAAGKPTINEEEITYADDGHHEFLETIKTPMVDSENQLVGILGVARDITQRKRQEAELRQLHNYLSNIIDSMPSMIVGVDVDGRITQWNKTAEKIAGITATDARGKMLLDVLPQMTPEMETISTSIESKSTSKIQKKVRQLKNDVIYEDVTIYPLISNGIEGAVIRVDDITDRVRMEEMMIQSEKMLSVGGLAAGMAHEINNPLAGMMQNAEVLSDRLAGDMPANNRAAEECGTSMQVVACYMEKRGILKMLNMIRESGRRAAAIVQSMLDFARKSDTSRSSNDIAALLDKTLELAATDYDLKKKYDFKQIEIVRIYEPDLPLVPCEAQKIQQVFLNILKNGAEAMQNRTLSEKPQFVLVVSKNNEMIRVVIADNGPGLDEAARTRVFEPFYTTKDQSKGTGLGLSVSYFIITKQHGGEMRVESTPGQGTKFIVELPLANQQE